MTSQRLFGTDGIRGVPGSFPLDTDTVQRTGYALATVLQTSGATPRVLIGRDTRESGAGLEAALTRGLLAGDVRVTSGGVLTTPAVSYLTRAGGFDAGIVISASHNPYPDNGIKVFSRDGFKLPENLEHQVEALALEDDEPIPVADRELWLYPRGADPLLKTRYVAFLASAVPRGFSFEGRRVVLDCANGAAEDLAPGVFERLGAEVHTIGCASDGRNINDGNGALHPEALAREVRARGAWLGAAYDGDADRCILVDETGAVRDGDDMLAVAATEMQREGTLGEAGVVSTVMANYGLECYLEGLGVPLVRTPVGDRFVVARMLELGARLGGEQSGHVVFLDDGLAAGTTGDGILTSLRLASLVARAGRPLSELSACWTRMPQVLRNVRVTARADLAGLPGVSERIAGVEQRLDGRGRLLVRYSGTEPLVRIMIEGPDRGEIEAWASELADAVREALHGA